MSIKVLGIDFAKITLCQALDLAVLVEEEAMERYAELADQLEQHRTPDAAHFFRLMQKNESKHRAALQAKRSALFDAAPITVTREMLFDIEAPEYDEVRIFMSLAEAFATAMRAETKARSFFEEALSAVTSAEVRELFVELRDEEIEHQHLVQREIDKLSSAPAADPEDYADGPISH